MSGKIKRRSQHVVTLLQVHVTSLALFVKKVWGGGGWGGDGASDPNVK